MSAKFQFSLQCIKECFTQYLRYQVGGDGVPHDLVVGQEVDCFTVKGCVRDCQWNLEMVEIFTGHMNPQCIAAYPGPLFTKRMDVLPQDLVKCGSHEIWV